MIKHIDEDLTFKELLLAYIRQPGIDRLEGYYRHIKASKIKWDEQRMEICNWRSYNSNESTRLLYKVEIIFKPCGWWFEARINKDGEITVDA